VSETITLLQLKERLERLEQTVSVILRRTNPQRIDGFDVPTICKKILKGMAKDAPVRPIVKGAAAHHKKHGFITEKQLDALRNIWAKRGTNPSAPKFFQGGAPQ
jgi:hypothetical protein